MEESSLVGDAAILDHAACARDTPANGASQVRLLWSEAGGPLVSPPLKLGFGTQLIRRSGQLGLGGEPDLFFSPDGTVCQMRFPLH